MLLAALSFDPAFLKDNNFQLLFLSSRWLKALNYRVFTSGSLLTVHWHTVSVVTFHSAPLFQTEAAAQARFSQFYSDITAVKYSVLLIPPAKNEQTSDHILKKPRWVITFRPRLRPQAKLNCVAIVFVRKDNNMYTWKETRFSVRRGRILENVFLCTSWRALLKLLRS